MRRFTGLLASVALLMVLLIGFVTVLPSQPVYAADYQDVTVTAQPLYLAITNTPSTWVLNGTSDGNSYISPNTTYYSNPQGDMTPPSATVQTNECRFNVTVSTGATTCDLTVNCSDFTGGDANMTNGNTGNNGATSYGGYSWYEGMTYSSAVIMQSSGSAELYSSLAADNSLLWGAEIETQTNAWTGGTNSTATMTITATEA